MTKNGAHGSNGWAVTVLLRRSCVAIHLVFPRKLHHLRSPALAVPTQSRLLRPRHQSVHKSPPPCALLPHPSVRPHDMQSVLAFTHPAAVSPVTPPPLTPLDGVALPGMPNRPHLQVYTGQTISCQLSQDYTPQDEYMVRDMFTPSPSSSVSYTDTPLPSYSQEAFMLPSYPSSSTSASPGAGPSSVAPSRREARRCSEPAIMNDGLVVRGPITHPYARIYNKKHVAGKRRKMWNHTLEKLVFTPQEMYVHSSIPRPVRIMTFRFPLSHRSTMGAPHRRTIYTASLEAHIDRLHDQLLSCSLAPVPFEKLEPYRGLNAKTAKV